MANGLFNLKQVIQAVQQGGWPAQKPLAVEYLVVAGGGGGQNYGGGGAGGLLTGLDPVPNGQTLLVTVGAGGSGGAGPTSGSNSVFGLFTTTGGGYPSANAASTGGSGAGAGDWSYVGAQGIAGQGNKGGNGAQGDGYSGGGGGGAGTAGINSGSGLPGNGGAGIASAISGTVTAYAGGGGGGHYQGSNSTSLGGAGGGGNGGAWSPSPVTAATSGTANTGGGGGGVSATPGAGGSGIVIISYPDVYAAAASTTGSPTVSTSGSGSFSFNGSSQTISTAASSLLALGSGDFTIEYWVKINGSGSFSRTFLITGSASVSIESNTYTSATTPYYLNYAGTQTAVTTGSSFDVTQWHHVAIVRSGTTNKVYLNGVQAMSATDATNYSSNGTLYIGSNNSANWLNGNVTNFRLVKGTAVYTTAFTPPTAPLTAISGTSILTSVISGAYLADNSGNAFTFTNTGSTAWNSASPFTVTGYKNRTYTWTSSGSITF
jgi:hypothetical protein